MNSYILLLGNPVSHSKSPAFQNAGLKAVGFDARYDAREVTREEMKGVADEVRDGRVIGANITVPHKAEAARLADRVDALVEATGAANTWYRDVDGALCATNTDIVGVQRSVRALRAGAAAERVLIVGSGGAAAAALLALGADATHIVVANRTLSRATELCEKVATSALVQATLQAIGLDELPEAQRDTAFDLVVQATSLPTLNWAGAEALAAHVSFDALASGAAVLDLCYCPEPTPFVAAAHRHGLPASDGAAMLLHQGMASFERWTGGAAPQREMRDALADALGRERSLIPI